MGLFTCSYNEFKVDMGIPVRASIGEPKFPVPGYNPERKVLEAAPNWSYLRASDAVYEREFYKQINTYGVDNFRKAFARIRATEGVADDYPLVLLCYEKLGKKQISEPEESRAVEELTCHRRMFAYWWEEQTGEVIRELGTMPKLKTQTELF